MGTPDTQPKIEAVVLKQSVAQVKIDRTDSPPPRWPLQTKPAVPTRLCLKCRLNHLLSDGSMIFEINRALANRRILRGTVPSRRPEDTDASSKKPVNGLQPGPRRLNQ